MKTAEEIKEYIERVLEFYDNTTPTNEGWLEQEWAFRNVLAYVNLHQLTDRVIWMCEKGHLNTTDIGLGLKALEGEEESTRMETECHECGLKHVVQIRAKDGKVIEVVLDEE